MSLSNEAAYLYVNSKKLMKVNKQLKELSRKAEKHKTKHEEAETEEKKHRHYHKHAKATDQLKLLIKEHNRILKVLLHHHVAFEHTLKSQHKMK